MVRRACVMTKSSLTKQKSSVGKIPETCRIFLIGRCPGLDRWVSGVGVSGVGVSGVGVSGVGVSGVGVSGVGVSGVGVGGCPGLATSDGCPRMLSANALSGVGDERWVSANALSGVGVWGWRRAMGVRECSLRECSTNAT
jgi:hypothetical protein